ncbi:MAG: PAS domain-containing protein [Candidatus Binatia bacterium]
MAINYLRSIQGRKADLKFKAELKSELVSTGAVLDLVPYPAALWSRDRKSCVLNESIKELMGFCDSDLEQMGSLWTDRIHPQDREAFLTVWNRFQSGETKISCEYRFFPMGRSREIRLSEVSCACLLRDGVPPVIWSFYSDVEDLNTHKDDAEIRQLRELLGGLAHEVGNALQAIRGELDLLRLAGALSQQSSKTITYGFQQMRKIAHEIQEYLSPPPQLVRSEDPAAVLTEVIQASQKELTDHGIRMAVVLNEPLPKLPLDWQFRSALRRVIEFSCALLPHGGELTIEASLHRIGVERYVELNLANASPTRLSVEEKDVFRPFLKVNDCSVGLSMAMARQVLRRRFGKIVFRKEQRNRGVFSILIKVPTGVNV